MKNNYAVIMAGGIGTRFWPMSTKNKPKQYHDVLGTGRTLIQQTYDRLLKVVPKENIFVITNIDYKEVTSIQLSELDASQIIVEPCMMNTAACNIYIAKKIHEINPDASIIVAPSDHIILNEQEFVKITSNALELALKEDVLITLGIEPTRPDTGYGYIQYKTEINENQLNKVKTFTEKPDLEHAQKFISSGDFLWNAGIFVWSSKTILNAFETYMNDMFNSFNEINSYNTENEYIDIEKVYPTVAKISIDYAIMEKADNVFVIPSNFGWSDLGTWKSLFENSEKNEENNAKYGKFVKTYNSKNNIIKANDNKAVVIDGLDGFIVVDTEKSLLICPIDKEQCVKNYVEDLKLNKGETFL